MDFFSRQDKTKRTSHLILAGFVLALLMVGFLIHALATALSIASGHGGSLAQVSTPAAALIGIMWSVMLLGGLFRLLDVRSGGAALAERYGAVKAGQNARHKDEQILLNVAAEVSIAAACPPPEIFVLRNESSINAFVVGVKETSRALVVSQGALDAFDREELQAVVAHEFGHIAQGDLAVNMRLLVALGGLNAIDEVGQMLMGDVKISTGSLFSLRPGTHRSHESIMHPGVIVGLVLRAVGSVGTFSGQLIRSAFSRQREFLADATGVQFTRNPLAMARALNVIQKRMEDGNRLHSPYQQELAHLCFHFGGFGSGIRRLLATHPPLSDRINAIEPHFDVKQREYDRERIKAKARDRSEGLSMPKPGAVIPDKSEFARLSLLGGVVAAATAAPGLTVAGAHLPAAANEDEHGIEDLSERIFLLLSDQGRCLAALFAMFASEEPKRRASYLQTIDKTFNAKFAESVKQILEQMPNELANDQLGIVSHVSAVLAKSSSVDNRQRILMRLESVLDQSDHFQLMNYATLQLVRRKLGVEFPIIKSVCGQGKNGASRRRVKPFNAMGSEFALLLSLMVESSGASSEIMDRDFQRVLKCYTNAAYPRRQGNEPGIVNELETAFQTLYAQPQTIRDGFVQHCVEIVEQDGHVARAERALLDLFAASLGCKIAA